jgi:NAD(P)H dehydrogenase (quinone)
MRSIITGVSGRLGRLAAEAALAASPRTELVLVTRDPDDVRDLAARGAVVRYGDFDEPATLGAAFAGGDRMLLTSTDQAGWRAVDAAVFAGIRTVGYVSTVNPSDSNPHASAAGHRKTEEYIRTSGLDWTFLRNSVGAETLLPAARSALASGMHLFNEGRGGTGYVSREDCAAVGAAFLTCPDERHSGKAYDVTGPEALTGEDVACAFARLGRRPVRAVPVDDDAWVASTVRRTGLPEEQVLLQATLGIAARSGYTATVSTAVQDLTGRPPRSLHEVLGGLL